MTYTRDMMIEKTDSELFDEIVEANLILPSQSHVIIYFYSSFIDGQDRIKS
jgi:hypothetical protein